MADAGGPRRVFPPDLDRIEDALDAGGVVAIPTDTVYGLAGRLDRPEALAAIFELKGRPPDLALPVLIAAPGQLPLVVGVWPETAERLSTRFWPGPLTLVVPAQPHVGRLLGGDGTTVGVRLPDHHSVQALCRRVGPLAATSANRHGAPPATTVDDVIAGFAGIAPALALVVDGGVCDGPPSTVVDCTTVPPACRREGALAWVDVAGALA